MSSRRASHPQVNIHDAKTTLSKIVDEVEGGATVTLARAGRPVAQIVPLEKKSRIKIKLNLQAERDPRKCIDIGFVLREPTN